MELVFQKLSAFFSKRRLVIPLFLAALLLGALLAQSVYSILRYDDIYSGVYINGIHIGALSTDTARSLLQKRIADNYINSVIELNCNGISKKFTIKDAKVDYMIDRAIDNAYLVGRKGSVLSRIAVITSAKRYGRMISLPYTYDQKAVNTFIDDIYSNIFRPVKQPDFTIDDENITIISGSKGYSFDKSDVLNRIETHTSTGTSGVINIPLIVTEPLTVTVNDVYNKVHCLPQNTHYEKANGDAVVVPHVIGRDIDRQIAQNMLDSVQGQEGAVRTMPLIISMPSILEEDLKSDLFRDELYSASSTFNSGNINRSHNIKLSSDKIDGTVLFPGEIFSYNDVVGPRTAELGYKTAATYIGGKIVDGTGGGICQVSSTLYNAVLFSDLEVVERTNHQFTVGYVLLGHDATVAYEQVDFKFKNSTSKPIKIISKVLGNKVTVTLKGTNENPGKTVQSRIDVKQTLYFGENIKYDSSLPEGTRKVTTAGINGYVVDLYKIIKQDGVVVSETLVSKSRYSPLKQEVTIGTKKTPAPEQPNEPEPEEPSLLSESVPEIPYNSVNPFEN